MNKRGQVYLIFSLIIGLVIFVLISQSNLIHVNIIDDDFKEISENYNRESNKFIGSLIKEGKLIDDISKQFTSFSILFTQYSKTQNPSFGLIYILSYNGIVYVGNFLDSDIEIIDPTNNDNVLETLIGCFAEVPISINYGDFEFNDRTNYEEFQNSGCFKELNPTQDTINLAVKNENVIYEINIKTNQPEVVVLSREDVGQDRLVFIEDEFIKGKKHNRQR